MALIITEGSKNVKLNSEGIFVYTGNIDTGEDIEFIGGDFIVDGNITTRGSIECGGRLTVRGSIEADEDVDADEALTVEGDASIGGSLTSSGNVTIKGSYEGADVAAEGNLSVGESIDVEDLYVKNNLNVGKDLNCEKAEIGGKYDIKGECVGEIFATHVEIASALEAANDAPENLTVQDIPKP